MKKITFFCLLFLATAWLSNVYAQTKGDTLVYCMPVFAWDGASNFTIDSVTFSNLIAAHEGCGYDYPAETSLNVTPPAVPESYTWLYTKDSAKVNAGQTYTLAVTSNFYNPPPMIRYAWFDWNQNGSFADPGEEYMISNEGSQLVDQTASLSITIPANAKGVVRMRVRMVYDGVTNTLAGKSCDSIYFHGGGCGETKDFIVNVNNIAEQVKEISTSDEISIYPNPTGGKCFMNLGNDAEPKIINVYDITGKQVYYRNIEKPDAQTILDLSNLNKGMYFLSVSSANAKVLYFKISKY